MSMTVPAGTVVAVRLQNAVSSATASPGRRLMRCWTSPWSCNGQTVADKGPGDGARGGSEVVGATA